MNSKRLLTLLLTVCLLLGAIAPAASAVTTGSSANSSSQGTNSATGPKWLNDLLVSVGDALGIHTVRDDQSHLQKDQLSYVGGQWYATTTDGVSVALTDSQLPDFIQALRAAAEHYGSKDLVPAFVVLEDDPTAESYRSASDVPASETAYLSAQQDALISSIEKTVLDGEALNVVTQFTHLTNAVVVETEFGNLEAIAALDGVKSVFLSPVYTACKTSTVVSPATVSSTQMTGVADVWQNYGYTGAGMTIAILDTGLDLDHPSFAADPEGAAWTEEWLQKMLDEHELLCEELYSKTLTASDLYYSAKVPFTFNYAMGSTNVSHADGIGDHGTHVAGIAAANDVEGSEVVGMAPDAQIVVMKVFDSETGGANMYDILKALEDCMTLGVDVVNMSLGSPAGFSESNIEEIDSIYARICSTDMIVDVAAGNEGTSSYSSMYGYYMQTTGNIDNATISSPSTYQNVLSIASVDNNYVYTPYFTLADGTKVFYMQSVEYLYGYVSFSLEILADQTYEYVMVPNLGAEEDFYDADGNSIVSGKIAVVKRGELAFSEKAANAEAAGAAAVLIWDLEGEEIFTFGMTTSTETEDGETFYPGIPVVLISTESGEKLAAAEVKTMVPSSGLSARLDSNGGQMSSFSCWGVAPDLSLLPDIAGVGGSVYSCYDGGGYGIMSGTSMASPQVAGLTALVLQYLNEKFPNATPAEKRTLVSSLMMSTATPVIDADTGLEASPRQQGAGLANAMAAITAEAYLSVSGSERPKGEMGDSAEGTFSFTFTVNNFAAAAKTYTLSSSLLCEDYTTDEEYPGVYFLAETEHALDNSGVSFSSGSTVTVPAGGSVDITVTVTLTEDDKEWIDTYFPSGNYVEGFVYLTGEEEVTLNLPFLGFYGQWDEAPVFDDGYWYENGFWAELYEEIVMDEVDANQYYHVLWTSMGSSNEDWILGMNPYEGAQLDENGNILYSPNNNVLSPNGDGILDNISDYYLSLMRNAEWVWLTYTDGAGNVLDQEALDKISKTMYISGYGSTVPFIYSWYYDDLYDFTDANGAYLPDGTTVYLTISGVIDQEGAQEDILCTIPIHIDTAAPVLDMDSLVESSDENGNYLTVTFTEAHPALAAVTNKTGTQIYQRYSENDMTDNGDGTFSLTLDVTGLGNNFVLTLCDYGCNEASYNLDYETDNLPEVDEEALYAYQVFDMSIYAYYGWDYMFGWSTIDKQSAAVEMLQSDAYEYYALTAAEYAGGYVFAVDAGHNFLYMDPGLWDRNLICNLGLNVVDMAFDDKTQTMYLAVSDDDAFVYGLYTVDLLSGDLTELVNYWSMDAMPWAMTFVDGNLYCCINSTAGFYQVDFENDYALIPVTTESGDSFMPKTATGNDVYPEYQQSMTYSAKDSKIYWAYYSEGEANLMIIDPSTWTCSSTAFFGDQEYAGLLTVEPDGYTLPESTEVSKLVISQEQVIMGTNSTFVLAAAALPWNVPAEMRAITWTSDDENVVTVDEYGVLTSVSEGAATVTAVCGSMSVSCEVYVVNVSGHMNAYKYYDGNYDSGYWLDIDLETVTETATFECPIDFMAADYNGHDGKIYGYTMAGQCYWFDPATGEYDTLGAADATKVPADMAYDYSSGLMYAVVYDYNTWTSTVYALNMENGKLVEMGAAADIIVTLACSTNGQLYGLTYDGILYELHRMEGSISGGGEMGGGGVMPLMDDDFIDDDFGFGVGGEETEPASYYYYLNYLLQTPMYELYYAQSMCYDHINDVLLWVNPESTSVYWIGGLNSWEPYCIGLGDPSGTGLIQYTGTHVIPEEIPELPYVPVESVTLDDMLLLVGNTATPSINVLPLNASNLAIWDIYTSDDSSSIVSIDENGNITAVSEGTVTVLVDWFDLGEDGEDNGDEQMSTSAFTVTVKNPTDNIYAYLMTDISNYDGYYWMNIPDTDPANYEFKEYVSYNGAYLTLYAAEYVDGTVYAYGYDDSDWNANFQFLTIDTKTWSVISAIDMGNGFPFVYDMAFDYTTGAMYAVAGPSDNTSDLYYVNMANGQLIECLSTGSDYMFMSLTVGADGTIYAMADSVETIDWETYSSTLSNAQLYTIDVESGAIEWFMDAGCTSNMLSTMAYDYDTGYIYWAALDSSYNGGLHLIDIEEKASYKLGNIGSAGCQVSGLMVIADEYPELPENLTKLAMVTTLAEVAVGSSTALETFILPFGLDGQITWTSADESVATVDENGVVTGVAAGITTITVTVSDGTNTQSASCTVVVYGTDDYFITYNTTDGGFSLISRPDSTLVTNFTEAEDAAAVTAMAMINGYIYAYDEENNLFVTSVADNFERTYIGSAGIEVDEPYTNNTNYTGRDYYTGETYAYGYETFYTPAFEVRDMAWDAANNRLLVVGCHVLNSVKYYWEERTDSSEYYEYSVDNAELDGGCKLYTVDLETGALEELCVVGGESPESGVNMLTITDSGKAFIYSYFHDYVMELDLETGAVTYTTTFQNQGVYGSSDGDMMAMTYDSITDSLYLLFTTNGNYYSLYQYNISSQLITPVDYVGEVTYSDWAYRGDSFAGLVLNEEHVCAHEVTDSQDATCTEDGYITYTCPLCGDTYTDSVPSSGHNYVDGTCTQCGDEDPGNAQTGDSTVIGLALLTAVVSAAALVVMTDKRKRFLNQ